MLPRLNNYGTFTYETTTDEDGNEKTTITADTAAETFVATALSSVYKIVNVCGGDEPDLSACGLPETYTTLDGATTNDFPADLKTLNSSLLEKLSWTSEETNLSYSYSSLTNTKAVGIETTNGESIAVYYNPGCESDNTSSAYYVQNKICVNMIYDLNGSKGPNRVGKDIGFITALYKNNPVVVAPMPYSSDAASGEAVVWNEASVACKEQDEDYRLPDRDEIAAIYYNRALLGNYTYSVYWSGSIISAGSSGQVWSVNLLNGFRGNPEKTLSRYVRCVKK